MTKTYPMRAATTAILLAGATSALASGFVDGTALYNFMTSEKQSEREQALGYVLGVADVSGGDGATKHAFCFDFPAGVSGGQVYNTIKRYLEEHPESRRQPASGLAQAALVEAFPCKPPKQK